MKLYVYDPSGGSMFLSYSSPNDFVRRDDDPKCLGSIEVEPVKMKSVKEAIAFGGSDIHNEVYYRFPTGAKNIKCTYEVEE